MDLIAAFRDVRRTAARQQEGDTRPFGDYELRYRLYDPAHDEWGGGKHVIEAFHPDADEPVGQMTWGTSTRPNRIQSVKVKPDHRRSGLATAMWQWGQEMTPRPKHSDERTDDGDAWARSVGGPLPRRRTGARQRFEIRDRTLQPGGTKHRWGKVSLTAHHPETGEQAGEVRYYPPNRKGGPLTVDDIRSDHPGATSALFDELESRHPGSRITHVMDQQKGTTEHNHPLYGTPTDWETHYPNLPEQVHRGMTVTPPARVAKWITSGDGTAAEHAALLREHLEDTGPIGMHWSTNEQVSKRFTHRNIRDPRTDVPIVLHADRPAEKDIETRPVVLKNNGVWAHDYEYGDAEVPVRRGRPVTIRGISWKPDAEHPEADEDGWVHHIFDEPLRHTAAANHPLSWDEIGERHPHIYGDPEIHGEEAEDGDGWGIGEAVNVLAHERPEDPEAEQSMAQDLDFHEEHVDPKHIDYAHHGAGDGRVEHARQGYEHHPEQVPPVVLVHRHGLYQVADGHHRAEAAAMAGQKVRAYVAYSPHEDEPFADGSKAPFHGAEPEQPEEEERPRSTGVLPHPQGQADLHQHLVHEHGWDFSPPDMPMDKLEHFHRAFHGMPGGAEHTHPESRTAAAEEFTPTKRIFGPTFGLDHRLFDGEHLKPEVRAAVLSKFDQFCQDHGYRDWRRWGRLIFFGSEASEWTSPTLEGNGDFDLSLGIDFLIFREMHPAFQELTDPEIADTFTEQMHAELNDPDYWFEVADDRTVAPGA